MLQHVAVAGHRVAEVLRKLFTIIVTNIIVRTYMMIGTFLFLLPVLFLFHTADIDCNEFLMGKYFKDDIYIFVSQK